MLISATASIGVEEERKERASGGIVSQPTLLSSHREPSAGFGVLQISEFIGVLLPFLRFDFSNDFVEGIPVLLSVIVKGTLPLLHRMFDPGVI